MPGTYGTAAAVSYNGDLANSLRDGPTSNAGASVEGFSNASNILNVPERKLFAGSIGLAITLPVAHIDVEAVIGPLGVETRWLGLRRHHQQSTRVAPSHTSLMSRRFLCPGGER